jgi:hypothetical protein
MGLSVRIFLFDDDDTMRRLPLSRYERLVRRDPKESIPEFAGKRVRYAEVIVELLNRKPVGILRIVYFILSFDSEGRVDPDELEKEKQIAFDVLPPVTNHDPAASLVDAAHRFAEKRYDDKYRWTPTPEIETAIFDAIFGKRPA